MTGPEPTPLPSSTTSDPKTGAGRIIDGKYEVLRELPTQGNVALYEVKAAEGITRRVAWFEVATPADRQQFHTYRTALRAIAPAGLTDIVARPGAYYAVWQDVAGTPLADFLAQPNKKQEEVDAVDGLATTLAEHGFALSDADVVMDGQTPRVAYLRPTAPRTAAEIAAQNTAQLAALQNGRIRKAKQPRRPREPGAWLTFIPGVLLLAGAGWLGAQAAQIYLSPPVSKVKSVTGRPAQEAASALVGAGFRVQYTYGDSSGVPVGAVMRQDPAEGTDLPIGRLVVLTVNKPQPLTVPKLEDMTLEEAKAPLKDNILKMGKVVKADGTLSNTPEGRIIAQTPAPGATTQRGQPVQVVVSSGVRGKETWIADLRGLTYEQAREHARDAGLVVVDPVVKEPSDKPENTVLRQNPAPFVRVTVGSPVKLVVSAAKFTPPSTPAGSLPIPPPYVPPPPPVEPDLGTGTGSNGSSGTDTNPGTPPPPVQTPSEIPPTGTGNSGSVGTTEPLNSRNVTFLYTFPSDLPAGTYTVVVQDADGEREVLRPTESGTLAGFEATAPATVRGNAVFIIRVGGAEYARIDPQ